MTQFLRITKREARRLFSAGDKLVYLCPCKMRPGYPWNVAIPVFGREYLEQADLYQGDGTLWKGTREATAWDLMYNSWAFYNATYETGYYACYYVEKR